MPHLYCATIILNPTKLQSTHVSFSFSSMSSPVLMSRRSVSRQRSSLPLPPPPRGYTLKEIIDKAGNKERTLHDILGGGTIADVLLWRHVISSLTIVFLATTLRIMCDPIESNFLAKLVMSLYIFLICQVFAYVLAFFHFLPRFGNYLHSEMERTVSNFTRVLTGIWHIHNPAILRALKALDKSLDQVTLDFINAFLRWMKDILFDIRIPKSVAKEVFQILTMITYGNPFKWALIFLQVLAFTAFFYHPASVMYGGYLCIATMPAIYEQISSSEDQEESQ